MNHLSNSITNAYEVSKKENSGVIITIKSKVYYYDLKKITHFEYIKIDRLTFRFAGNPHEEAVSGELAKCLYAALTDWHKGVIL